MLASPQVNNAANLTLSLDCSLEAVRPVARAAREFLSRTGLSEEELMSCELALVEAGNNAVLYALPSRTLDKVEITLFCDETKIEMCVRDHTQGFDLPEQVQLADTSEESGRGLFLIQSLMDSVRYERGDGENTLTMRKRRARPTLETHDLKLKLAESEQVINEMAEELSSCYESLSAIFRSGAELGKAASLKNFSQSLCEDLLRITNADWFLLRLATEDGSELRQFNSSDSLFRVPALPVSNVESNNSAELRAARLHKDVWFSPQFPLAVNDPLRAVTLPELGLIHPLYFGERLVGTLAIAKTQSNPFTAAQVNTLHAVANFLAMQVINDRLHAEELEHRLVARDLEIARGIQKALLPKKLPQLRGIEIAGFCESARHVGGDFYDVVSVDEKSALLVVADVMGKGIPAALFAAIFRSVLRGASELTSRPGTLLAKVNRLLYEDLSEVEMFITAQLAFVNAQTRKIVVANAGHCPALLFGANAEPKIISPDGMPLGVLRDAQFSEATEVLPQSGCLVLHTDGVTEARNVTVEFFGRNNLVSCVNKTIGSNYTAETLKDALVRELRNFQGECHPSDDQTFLILSEGSCS